MSSNRQKFGIRQQWTLALIAVTAVAALLNPSQAKAQSASELNADFLRQLNGEVGQFVKTDGQAPSNGAAAPAQSDQSGNAVFYNDSTSADELNAGYNRYLNGEDVQFVRTPDTQVAHAPAKHVRYARKTFTKHARALVARVRSHINSVRINPQSGRKIRSTVKHRADAATVNIVRVASAEATVSVSRQQERIQKIVTKYNPAASQTQAANATAATRTASAAGQVFIEGFDGKREIYSAPVTPGSRHVRKDAQYTV